jgi:phosphoglycolate phosphatase-like HAD superfamily hydrolase
MNNSNLGKIEAILFDLSGTLVNDLLAVYNGYVDLCKKYDIDPPSLIKFREEFKLPYPTFLSEKGYTEIGDAINFWKNAYMNHGSLITLFSDVIPALDALKKFESVKLGVVSQTPREQVMQNLEKFRLQTYFNNIVLDLWKPNPKGLLQALQELEIKDSQNVIYVGDMKEDLQAAQSANIQPWAIYRENGGFHTLENIKKGSPKIILKALTEITTTIS